MSLNEAAKQRLQENKAYIEWGLVALFAAVAGMLSILTFANVFVLGPAPPGWPWKATVLDKVAHGQVVNAAVTWFAGVVALYTYFLTRDQKEKHLQRQLEQAQQIEEARERRERDLAELQRIEAEFAALAADFAQESALARINAAIGLGEIARKPDPRRLDAAGKELPDPRSPIRYRKFDAEAQAEVECTADWPAEWRSAKTENNYPYFLRAAHRLAAALHQWEDKAPRAQALRVLKEIGEWAKDEGTDEPLLHDLVNALAEANRTAWSLLREKVTQCLVAGRTSPEVLELSGVPDPGPGKSNEYAHRAFVSDLTEGLEGSASWLAFAAARSAVFGPSQQTPGDLESQLRSVGQRFWATRDALAVSLRTLSVPPEHELLFGSGLSDQMPTDGLSHNDDRILRLRARRALHLSKVRMLLANCRRAQLQGVHCHLAHLEGVNWGGALFSGADCRGTGFQGANCTGTLFTHARCESARFAGATCSLAHFEGADCSYASFDAADCSDTSFMKANCRLASLLGADCMNARFRGAKLGLAKMGQHGGTPPALDKRILKTADFRIYEYSHKWRRSEPTERKDEALIAFLKSQFPSD